MDVRTRTALFATLLAAAGLAQEKAAEDPAHDALRKLRKDLTEAVNKADIQAVLSHCTPNVILTAQNAEVSRGRDGVKAYFDKMMTGPQKRVQSFTVAPEPEDLSVLYGGATAVAFGHSADHYVLTDGSDFTVNSRWSATLVKEGDKWLVANFHVSCNIFDNPILNMAKRALYWTGGIAVGVGLLLGLVAGRAMAKR